jgi:hypothetical protein
MKTRITNAVLLGATAVAVYLVIKKLEEKA